MITSENRSAWQAVGDNLSPNRPSVGKIVTVDSGKHKGKTGIVVWHGVDQYSDATRYMDNARLILWEMEGRYGFRVGIKTDSGEKIFVNADKVTVQNS